MFGRFPVYVDEEITSIDQKWSFVLEKIESVDPAVARFIEEAPDGVLRVIGPFKAKRGNVLILASPLPALFHFLVLNVPRVLRAVIKPDRPYVEIKEKKDLFEPPGTYILKVKYCDFFSLKQLARDMEMFLGMRVNPEFLPLSYKRMGHNLIVTLRSFNDETSALVRFARFCGVGKDRKHGFGDVEVFRVVDA